MRTKIPIPLRMSRPMQRTEGHAITQGEGRELVRAVEIELRAGLRERPGLSRVFRQ
jgi:hypothetical protein